MKRSPQTIAAGTLAGLLISVLFGAMINPGAWHGDLVNPDSAMRLIRLDAMVQAHAALDTVARDGSGSGTVLHWSHLLDSLLLLLAAPVAVFTGWQRALLPAAMLFGPLSMMAVGAALAWATAPFADRQWRWIAAVVASLSGPIVGYGVPGVVHHHVLLAAIAVMTAGCAVRVVRGEPAGVGLGAWAGVAVWLSPESMPLSLMALCLVWVAWLSQPRLCLARGLAQSGLALFAVVLAAWCVDPPASRWAAEQDRISVIYVTLAGAAAVCGVLAQAGWPRLVVASIGGALAMVWLAAFPALLQGTYGLLPADAAHLFLDGIAEMQPVAGLRPAIGLLLPAALAAATLAVLGVRHRSVVLAYGAVCGLVLVGGGAEHLRFAAYPAIFAAALAPVALTAIGNTVWRTPVLAAALLLPLSYTLVPDAGAAPPAGKLCNLQGVETLLGPYAGQVVLANVNDTPELLWRTGVLTVGSLYHRNPAGFLRLVAAWRSEPGATVPPALLAAKAQLVLACPGGKLPRIVTGTERPTLASALRDGHVPPWLHPVGATTEGGLVLYQVSAPPA